MTPREPSALRASLDARLQLLARERAQDVNRLRRHLAFQRLLRRLDDGWVLKGGYLLEARLGARARATKDLDLVAVPAGGADDLAELLAESLEHDVDRDGFVFRVVGARAHLADAEQLGGAGARLSVTVLLAGRDFVNLRVDVVARPDEVDGGTERITLPVLVAEPGWEPITVIAVDTAQHAAEKLHALSAVDVHPRPSTRVKDLLDVVLLVESGTLDGPRLGERLSAVFQVRDGASPPQRLPEPPAAWQADYEMLAAPYDVSARTLSDALALAHDLYSAALSDDPSRQESP